jgi:hypothetical protein
MGFKKRSGVSLAVMLLAVMTSPLPASAVTALLLFDGETGRTFVGCLNCGKYQAESVCNKYGEFGSKYQSGSIWNSYGDYGSKYQTNSPWNKYGEGLRVVDPDGNYYGRMTLAVSDRSREPLVRQLLEAYEEAKSLDELRDLLCE